MTEEGENMGTLIVGESSKYRIFEYILIYDSKFCACWCIVPVKLLIEGLLNSLKSQILLHKM